LKIAISGSSGFIGSNLITSLISGGNHVIRIIRNKKVHTENTISWDPYHGTLESSLLEGIDAVVHLSGENIGSGIWTKTKKEKIRDSRLISTRLLAEKLSELKKPPKTLLVASATGYYGDQADNELSETDSKGTGFLADLCQEWEDASHLASCAGIRIVNLRFGIILHHAEGTLKKLIPVFKSGLGAVTGNGRQFMSWISIDDVVEAIQHVLNHDELEGPVNFVSPNPVTNKEFSKILASILRRPLFFKIPGFLLSGLGGEMARELLLTSNRVRPQKLLDSGYNFIHSDLQTTLRFLLDKNQDVI